MQSFNVGIQTVNENIHHAGEIVFVLFLVGSSIEKYMLAAELVIACENNPDKLKRRPRIIVIFSACSILPLCSLMAKNLNFENKGAAPYK